MCQQIGGERCVAQLVDVRTRVREAERHVVVGEQMRDRVDVVVGDVRAEASTEILVDGQLAQHVERAAPALGREIADAAPDQFGKPIGLGHLEGLPPRLHRRLLEVGGRPRPPLRIAVRGDARITITLQQFAEHPAGVEAVRVGHRELHRERPRRDLRPYLCTARERRFVQSERFEVLSARRREHGIGERPPDRGCHSYTSAYVHCVPGVMSTTPLPASPAARNSASTSSASEKRLGTGLPSTPRCAYEKLVENPAPPAAIPRGRARTCARSRPAWLHAHRPRRPSHRAGAASGRRTR